MKILTDSHGRRIDYLRISVTDRCNLRCVYCIPEGIRLVPRRQILRYEEIMEIAKIAISCGIKRVKITGGDPLVRRDVIKLIESLANLEGLEDLSLTTNGILLEKYARDLKRAGLARINISCDTLNDVRFREITGGGELKKVLAGINEVRAAGFHPIKLNVVLLKGINEDEVLDFALLAKDYPFVIRFIEFMPISSKRIFKGEGFLPLSFVKGKLESLGRLAPTHSVPGAGPASYFKIKGFSGRFGFIGAISSHSCSNCNRLRLTADGKLRPCLFSSFEIDLKEPLRKGAPLSVMKGLFFEAVGAKQKERNLQGEGFGRAMSQIGG